MKSSHRIAALGAALLVVLAVGALTAGRLVGNAAAAFSRLGKAQDVRVEIMLQVVFADGLIQCRQANDDLGERESIQSINGTSRRIETLFNELADGVGTRGMDAAERAGAGRDVAETFELWELYRDATDEIVRGREVSRNLAFLQTASIRLTERLTNVAAAAERRGVRCSRLATQATVWSSLLAALLVVISGWVLKRELFDGMHRVIDFLQLLSSGTLSPDAGLPESDRGDVGRLAVCVNRVLRRSREADHTKNRFLAAMSHEIRTPMNGVIGFLGNLRETPLNEQQSQYVRIIESSARSLLKVISGILDFSKLSAGKVELEDVAFDINRLVQDCVSMTRQLVRGKPVHVSLDVQGLGQHIIRGDPTRLRQILDNLLGNAAKFTDRGDISLQLAGRPRDDGTLDVTFSVRDTGIGITPSEQAQLFQPFRQADAGTTRKYGGTGLGLCIASSLVSLMGGKLDVSSRPGEGSTFSFSLLVRTARPEEKVQLAGHYRIILPPGALRKFWALLVDDTPTNLFLMETICQSIGLPYRTAANGKEAVDLAQTQRFDIVFMDIQMPVMDGYTAIREIRKLATSGHTQIVALTASAFQEDVDKALGAGSTGFLAKPFERNQLLLCIAQHLDISVERELREPLEAGDTPDDMSVRQMYDFMRDQYEIGLGEIKMILVQTIADWRPLLDDLNVFAKRSDWDEVRMITHRLKGQLASIGLPYFAAQAAAVTAAIRTQETTDLRERIEAFTVELSGVFRAVERDITVDTHSRGAGVS